jgi:hypothetical protein
LKDLLDQRDKSTTIRIHSSFLLTVSSQAPATFPSDLLLCLFRQHFIISSRYNILAHNILVHIHNMYTKISYPQDIFLFLPCSFGQRPRHASMMICVLVLRLSAETAASGFGCALLRMRTVAHSALGCIFFSHARANQSVLSPRISFLRRRRTTAHARPHHCCGWPKRDVAIIIFGLRIGFVIWDRIASKIDLGTALSESVSFLIFHHVTHA